MKFDLSDVFGSTWKIGWNHKVLWLWQMLPSLIVIFMMPLFFITNPAFLLIMPEPINQYADEPWVIIASSLLIFVLVIPSLFAGILAQVATVRGAVMVEQGAEKLGFRELFDESKPSF